MKSYCFIGLDLGRYTVSVSVLDEPGQVLDAFSFEQTHIGYEQMIDKVKRLQQNGYTPVIAAEGHDGNLAPLDEYLLAEQWILKPLHPTAVSRFKEVLGQPHKTDDYDAYVIASLLRQIHHQIPQKVSSAEVAQLKSLSRTYKTLAKTKTRLNNQLQAELMSYFPELITHRLFSTITGPTVLNLLGHFPQPEQIAKLDKQKLTQFLSHHSKGHIGAEVAEKLIAIAQSVTRCSKAAQSKSIIVSTLANTLLSILTSQKQLKKQMSEIAKQSVALKRLTSIPGVDVVLASRFIGEVITINRFLTEAKLAMFVGVAPLADDSGKRSGRHRTTHRANKIAKDAILQIAACNCRVSPLSKAYYQTKRDAGKSHWQALKCLARQLVKLIYALFRNQTFYQSVEA